MRWVIQRWGFWYVLVLAGFFIFFREEPLGPKLSSLSYKRRIERAIKIKMQENQKPAIYDLTWGIAYYQDMIDTLGPIDYAYGNQGFCYYYLGKTAEALRMYEKAIKLNPGQYSYYWDQGMIYAQENRLAEAISSLEKALDILPITVNAYVRLSQDRNFLGSFGEQAVFDGLALVLERASEDRYWAYMKLADIFSFLGESRAAELMRQGAQEALKDLRQKKALSPELYGSEILTKNNNEDVRLHFNVNCFSSLFMEIAVMRKIQGTGKK